MTEREPETAGVGDTGPEASGGDPAPAAPEAAPAEPEAEPEAAPGTAPAEPEAAPAEPEPEPEAAPGTAPAEPEAAPAEPEPEAAPAEPEAEPEPEPEAAPPVLGELTEAQLEALLFVAEKPLSRPEIARLAGVDRETVDDRLGDLEVSLSGRGIRVVLSGDRVELATAPEAGALVARYVGADAVRLSPAALETLAIIAYRQPITKAGIERIRGVDSDYTVRALLHRRLIAEQGRSEAPGRPIIYGTGFEFLERFGLTSLEELPALDLDVATRLVDGLGGAGDGAAGAPGGGAAGADGELPPEAGIDAGPDA